MEKCGICPEEESDEENEYAEEVEPQGDVNLVIFLKSVLATSSRPWSEVPRYDRSLNVEELIDWINTLNKYFNYEEVHEAKKVNFVATKQRGHASI